MPSRVQARDFIRDVISTWPVAGWGSAGLQTQWKLCDCGSQSDKTGHNKSSALPSHSFQSERVDENSWRQRELMFASSAGAINTSVLFYLPELGLGVLVGPFLWISSQKGRDCGGWEPRLYLLFISWPLPSCFVFLCLQALELNPMGLMQLGEASGALTMEGPNCDKK